MPERNAQARGKVTQSDTMIRRMLDDLQWLFRKRTGPGQERYYLRQLTRKPMTYQELSINPSGNWSTTKAKRVLEIINPEAAKHGLIFRMLDVSTFDKPNQIMLVAYCVEHDIAVVKDQLCSECARHIKHA